MLTAGSEIDVVERVNYRLFHSLGPRTDSYMYTVRHVELARLLLMWWLSLQLFFNWGSPIALVTLWLSKWPGDGFKLQCCCCMSSVMVLGLSWLWVQDGFRAVDWCQDQMIIWYSLYLVGFYIPFSRVHAQPRVTAHTRITVT